MPWFRERLAELGLSPHPTCLLEQSLRAVEAEAIATGKSPKLTYQECAENRLRVFGTDFLTKALDQADTTGWSAWRSRAELLLRCDPNPFFPATQSSGNQSRDMAWEMVIAAVCSTFCSDVRFEEPDVVATYNGRRVGIAAKCLYSKNVSKLHKRVKEGADQGQTQADAAATDLTVVFVNLTSMWPHALLLRGFVESRTFEADAIKNALAEHSDAQFAGRDEKRMLADYAARGSLESVLLCIPTLAPVETDFLFPFFYSGLLAERANPLTDFASAFHRATQKVLKWESR